MISSYIGISFVIIVYLLAMLLIGVHYSHKNESSVDFYLGGRKLGPIVTAMSAEAGDMSSYLLMGLPGLAYLTGTADVGWTVIGLAIGTYLNWLLIAKRLRIYTNVTGSYTLPQFFANRFDDKKNILTLVSALIIIVFFIPYTASGFAACGKLFSSLFGINYMLAMIISAFVIVGYTALGGFMATSITDLIQGIIMTIAIVSVLIFTVILAGGVDAILNNAHTLPGFLSLSSSYNPTEGTSYSYGILQIITTLSWGLGYFGMPHILLRFMAIKDEKKLALSRRIASIWVVIAMSIAVLIGIVGKVLSNQGVIAQLIGNNTETIVVKISDLIASYGILPALLAGLVLSGILASTMSTADSQLLAASSSVTEDILHETCHISFSKKNRMLISRFTVITIAILGIVFASNPNSSIFQIVSFAWAGFGASFGPLVLCALFWKRTNLLGAVSGMFAGGLMTFVWHYLIRPLGGIFSVYELLPAFIVSLLTIILVSYFTKRPTRKMLADFRNYTRSK